MKLRVKILESHHTLFKECVDLFCISNLYELHDPVPRVVQSNKLNFISNELGEESIFKEVLDTVGIILSSGAYEVILETEEEIWNWNKFLSFSDIKC